VRLLIITTAYPASASDSRGTFMHTLCRALVREGLEVTVVCPGSDGVQSVDSRDGVSIRRATYWFSRWQGLAEGVGGIVPNLRAKPWLVLQVPSLIISLALTAWRQAAHADVIHAHWVYPGGLIGLLVARRRRKPFLVTSHGGDLNLAARFVPLQWLSRWIATRADACIAVSHAMEAAFFRLGVSPRRVHFVPLGVDDDVPAARAAPSENKFYTRFRDSPGFKILYVGSLIPRKAVDVLIAAHGILQHRGYPVACAIVGSGPAEAALRRLAKEGGVDEPMFAGPSPHMLIPHWLKAADVLVLPSRSEGRGMVLVEAMALGVPVVASDIPGPNELIRSGENGFLFPFGDSAALADCLAWLIDNEQLRLEMGRAGHTLMQSEGLTAQCCARQHNLLYRDVLHQPTALRS